MRGQTEIDPKRRRNMCVCVCVCVLLTMLKTLLLLLSAVPEEECKDDDSYHEQN